MKFYIIISIFLFFMNFMTVEAKEKVQFDREIYKSGDPIIILKTSKGDIYLELFEQDVPNAVKNFLGLAFGEKEFINPKSGKSEKKKFYDGLLFHRVIPNFMIQGGDPLGTGMGGPGYKFKDEIVTNFKHIPGTLAYANSGPNSNGSQFYITSVATPWLDGHYTIFGQVLKGLDVVLKIASVKRDSRDKPLEPIYINEIVMYKK